MRLKNLLKNDDAVSITVGFILMLSITMLIFSAVVISFSTLTSQSEKIAMRESFETMGSGLAARVTTLDVLINITNSYGGTVDSLDYEFSIPPPIAYKDYSIEINSSTKQIIIEAENGAQAWIPFNTSVNFAENKIYGSSQNYRFIYDKYNNTLKIESQ